MSKVRKGARKAPRKAAKPSSEITLCRVLVSDLDALDLALCPDVFDPASGATCSEELTICVDRSNRIIPGYGDKLREKVNLFKVQRLEAACFVKAATIVPKPLNCAIQELLLMSLKNKDIHPDREVFLHPDRLDKVKSIGSLLFSIGKHSLMYQCADIVPRYDQRELDMAWDGVGDWRC